jgi:CheY-like chemotaxis protein
MPQIQDVNLIMMTAYTYKIDDHDFKDSGFVDTVSKPVDSKVIFRKIRNAIGQEEGLYTSDDKSISDDNQVSYEGVNILVADDTEVNCLIMEHMLSSMGCEVTICVNGLEALELAKKNKYDLILLDWQMPVMDGPTAARNITEWANENNQYLCPIITFTANINIGDENQLLANGIKDFMSKPIHKSDIISIFNKWL